MYHVYWICVNFVSAISFPVIKEMSVNLNIEYCSIKSDIEQTSGNL